MTYQSLPSAHQRSSARIQLLSGALGRQRLQLGGILLLGLVLPFLVRFGWEGIVTFDDHLGTSGLVLAGILLSHMLVSQFSSYPGETPLTVSLTSASLGFGVVALLIMSTHVSYSRSMLMWGYFATIWWYATLCFLRSRYGRRTLAVIPGGQTPELLNRPRIDWVHLSAPLPLTGMKSVEGVLVDLSAEIPAEWQRFVLACGTAGVPVFDSTRTKEMVTGQVELSSLSNIGFETLLPNRTYQKFKNVLDIAVAVATLPAVLPIIGITAAAIRLEGPGPVFFVQSRMGYHGRVFNCYKMRSMKVSAETMGPRFTADSDTRITRVGQFIRKYHIDELPQVFNIIKGDMSWIGPRPEAVELAEHYERNIPYYAFRHAVKPGISGWAAIRQGNVAEVTAATTKLRHDFFYIKNLSFSLDAFIAAKTVWAMLTGAGSK
ncbi:MAG: sugar transferase [Aestuariivirga sp.]|nr:sugar transferase [Aestuariivirga sp.]